METEGYILIGIGVIVVGYLVYSYLNSSANPLNLAGDLGQYGGDLLSTIEKDFTHTVDIIKGGGSGISQEANGLIKNSGAVWKSGGGRQFTTITPGTAPLTSNVATNFGIATGAVTPVTPIKEHGKTVGYHPVRHRQI
jgi:hypothetical protein